jgi:hypothetical protein
MAYANGILTAPLSLGDIATALGTTSLDLGTLCTSPSIDKWARYKPIVHHNIGYVSEAGRRLENYGLSATRFQQAGRCIMPAYAWEYTRPSSHFRALDFVQVASGGVPSTTVGYKNVGVAPCRGFYAGSDTGQLATYKYYLGQNSQAAINVYAITTGSDFGIGLAEMGSLTNYYFALAVVVDSTHTYVVTSAQNIGAGVSDPTVTGWQTITVPTDSTIFNGAGTYEAYVLLCNQCHTSWWQAQTSVSNPLYYYALPVTDPTIAEITFSVISTTYSAWCQYASRKTSGTLTERRKVTYTIYGQNTTTAAVTVPILKVELVYAASAEDVAGSTTIIATNSYTNASIPVSATGSLLSTYSGELGSQTGIHDATSGTLWVRVTGINNGSALFSSFTQVKDVSGTVPDEPLPRD